MIKHNNYPLYFYDDKSDVELDMLATAWIEPEDCYIDEIEIVTTALTANIIDLLFTAHNETSNTLLITSENIEYKFDKVHNEVVVNNFNDDRVFDVIMEHYIETMTALEDNADEMKREAML